MCLLLCVFKLHFSVNRLSHTVHTCSLGLSLCECLTTSVLSASMNVVGELPTHSRDKAHYQQNNNSLIINLNKASTLHMYIKIGKQGGTERQMDSLSICLSGTDNRIDGLTDSDSVCHVHDTGCMTHVAYKQNILTINHASISYHFLNKHQLNGQKHGISPTSPILVAPTERECHEILNKIRILMSQIWIP